MGSERRRQLLGMMRDVLRECAEGKGQRTIRCNVARDMLGALDEIEESYNDELDALGYEARAERERD